MEFLEHRMIKKKVTGLLSSNEEVKIAVAYWGSHALELLRLNPRRRDLQVLCCLKGGSSDPSVIGKFGDRAHQIDNLHAKVFWTGRGAIVGSANASANGLPEQDEYASKLIEAGVYVDEKDELAKIERWFDGLYDEFRPITKTDLDNAQQERAVRLGRKPSKRRSLLAALESNPSEFSQQRIFLYLYEEYCSREEERSVEQDMRAHSNEIRSTYANIPDLDELDYYTFTRRPPRNYFPPDSILIEGRYEKGRVSKDEFYIRRTFKAVSQRQITVSGEPEWWMPVLEQPSAVRFNYKLNDRDKKIISDAAMELWEKGRKGVEKDKLISLTDARPILHKHSDSW